MSKKLIAIITLVSLLAGIFTSTALAATATRTGSSSGKKWFFVRSAVDWGWKYKGTSKSTSTIVEDVISVQGELKIGGVTHDTCNVSRSGTKAVCSTSGELRLPLTGRVESNHFFNTPSYGKPLEFNTSVNF